MICWRRPCDDSRPARVSARSWTDPSTLTNTRAWRRSGLVATAVTVTKPMRGSSRPSAIRAESTSRTASLTLRMRSMGILEKVLDRHHMAFHGRAVGKHGFHVAGEAGASLAERAGLASDQGSRQRRALPELVVIGLGHCRAEAALKVRLERAQLPALAFQASILWEVQVDLEETDEAQVRVCSTRLVS